MTDERTRVKKMLVEIIKKVLKEDYIKLVKLVNEGAIEIHWELNPPDFPTVVCCTFRHKNKPLFSFSLTPELKDNLADYFCNSFSQRINTIHEKTTARVKENVSKTIKNLNLK